MSRNSSEYREPCRAADSIARCNCASNARRLVKPVNASWLAWGQFVGTALGPGHVAEHDHRADRYAPRRDRRECRFHQQRMPFASHQRGDVMAFLRSCHQQVERRPLRIAQVEDVVQGPPQRLDLAPSDQVHGRGVERGDASLQVDRDDAIGNGASAPWARSASAALARNSASVCASRARRAATGSGATSGGSWAFGMLTARR